MVLVGTADEQTESPKLGLVSLSGLYAVVGVLTESLQTGQSSTFGKVELFNEH